MGYCKDCASYGVVGVIGQRGYCSFFSKPNYDRFSDKNTTNYYYVLPNGSCKNFRPKNTPGSSGASGYYSNNGGGCFLTSACVEYLGKADDCEELTALRTFRDGYIKSVDGGEELIGEYYAVAPKIVESINASAHKDKYYAYINEIVNKCIKLISLKENDRALIEYKFMVENLKKEFGINN